jgi:hypothetical protein
LPAASPVIVVLAPVPDTAPGLIVQFPVGKLLSMTLPVAVAHVGCVIVPAVGAAGVRGWAFIVALVGADVQVLSAVLLARTLCVPADRPVNVTEACHAPPSILYS